MSISPNQVRSARAAIISKGFNAKEIPPKLLALTAKRLNKPLDDVLQILSFLKMRGQGEGQSPLADQYDHGDFGQNDMQGNDI